MTTQTQRFWKKVSKGAACWEWIGHRHVSGYGWLRRQGKSHYAHRTAWELTFGSIPEGMCVCHRCDNPPCCNPAHLFLGTHTDNMRDMIAKGRGALAKHPPPHKVGSSHGRAKLTETDVVWIRHAVALGVMQNALARAYGVSCTAIYDAVRRRKWSHI